MKNKPMDVLYCGVRQKKIKHAQPVLDEEVLNILFHYIKERYTIHVKRDVNGERGVLTEDPILAAFRFTNVRREHDTNSIWIINHISKNDGLTYRDKVLNTFVARMYSRFETMEVLGLPIHLTKEFSPKELVKHQRKYMQENPDFKWFSGSFLASGSIACMGRMFPQSQSGAEHLLWFLSLINDNKIYAKIKACQTQQEVYKLLLTIPGCSQFFAYQIFVDLTYIDEFPFSENEFTIAGPGCKRGLNHLFKDRNGMNYEECLFWLRDNWDELNTRVKKVNRIQLSELMVDVPKYDRKMNVMSLENCFCELSKYIRTLNGGTQPRKKYVTK